MLDSGNHITIGYVGTVNLVLFANEYGMISTNNLQTIYDALNIFNPMKSLKSVLENRNFFTDSQFLLQDH